jgi:hypothetical protein
MAPYARGGGLDDAGEINVHAAVESVVANALPLVAAPVAVKLIKMTAIDCRLPHRNNM